MNVDENTSDVFSLVDLRIIAGMAAGKTQAEIGAELHLEQPAISKLLRASEARSGLPLVEQVGRRLTLTARGRDLAAAAGRTLAAFDDVDRLAEDLLAARRGTVRIMASSTPGSYVLPEIVAAFLRDVPNASIQLHTQPISSLWAAFDAQRCDYAVVPTMGLPGNLVSEPLYADPVVLFAAPRHPLTRRANVPASRSSAPRPSSASSSRKPLGGHRPGLEQHGFAAGKMVTLIPPEGVKRMVAAGNSVGICSSRRSGELERGTLVRLRSPARRRRSTSASPAAPTTSCAWPCGSRPSSDRMCRWNTSTPNWNASGPGGR